MANIRLLMHSVASGAAAQPAPSKVLASPEVGVLQLKPALSHSPSSRIEGADGTAIRSGAPVHKDGAANKLHSAHSIRH